MVIHSLINRPLILRGNTEKTLRAPFRFFGFHDAFFLKMDCTYVKELISHELNELNELNSFNSWLI